MFCSGTMNNFSYKQFLLFLKKDMDKLKENFNSEKDLIFGLISKLLFISIDISDLNELFDIFKFEFWE